MKKRLLSPGTFIRLPWVSWEAPKAIRSDMGGPSLFGLFRLAVAGRLAARRTCSRPSGGEVLPTAARA